MASSKLKAPWNTVWVIGASSGIGKAFSELCAGRGMNVIISARSADDLDAMAVRSARFMPLPLDVTVSGQIRRALAEIESASMLPDLALYCAGTYEPVPDWRIDADLFASHMSVNYLGAVRVLGELLPPLVARGSGHIALVASLTGYCGLPKATAYGPTKAAIISLCESLKLQTDAVGLTLSVINPGFVETGMTARNDFEMPYLMTAGQAARDMYEGLARQRFEIAFPKPLVWRLKIARSLPYRFYFKVMKRLAS